MRLAAESNTCLYIASFEIDIIQRNRVTRLHFTLVYLYGAVYAFLKRTLRYISNRVWTTFVLRDNTNCRELKRTRLLFYTRVHHRHVICAKLYARFSYFLRIRPGRNNTFAHCTRAAPALDYYWTSFFFFYWERCETTSENSNYSHLLYWLAFRRVSTLKSVEIFLRFSFHIQRLYAYGRVRFRAKQLTFKSNPGQYYFNYNNISSHAFTSRIRRCIYIIVGQ